MFTMLPRTVPFTFGEPEFTCFYKDSSTPLLSVLIWYKSASSDNRYSNLTVYNHSAEDRYEALEQALRHTTRFVRERWFLIEVTTPLQLFLYGRNAEGGHRRLRVTRSVEKTVEAR